MSTCLSYAFGGIASYLFERASRNALEAFSAGESRLHLIVRFPTVT